MSRKKDANKMTYRQIISVLKHSVREYKKPSIITIFFVVLEVLCECVIPYVMSLLLNYLSDQQKLASVSSDFMNVVLIYSAILLGLAIFSFVSGLLAGRFAARASTGFAANVRKDLFYKIQTFSFNNIDRFSVSSLVTRQTTDITYVQMCFQMMIRIVIRAPLMLIFSLVMAIVMAAYISWIFAIVIPILAVTFIIVTFTSVPIFNRVFPKYDKLNESIEENVRGIRTVKTYHREDYEKAKFSKASENIRDDFVKAERLLALTNPLLSFCMYLSMTLIIFFGSMAIIDPNVSFEIGQLSAMITYSAQILSSLMMISMVLVMISMSTVSMRRVCEVLIEVPTITNPADPIFEVSDGSIDFENVSFKYKKEAEKYALADINLHIASGQTVGIIGGTGSSKSTLVNLISRFYDTTEGSVKVGGVDVRNYDIRTLRENVSMVLQKNVLFSGTIKENLLWGNKKATDEDIKEACHIAQADTFVESFPDKYETMILQGGTNVSGGQKQRLCIARAIIKKPKVLIMDDSTSAVDTKTDAFIRMGLKSTLPNTTKIIIAQRLSSVQEADFIIVMDDGKINGMGTHDELLANNELYRDIYNIQNRIGGDNNA